MCVDPVPLVREVPLARVCVGVCPRGGAPDAAVVLGLEDLREDRRGLGREEGLGHEDQLVVHCVGLAMDVAWLGRLYRPCSSPKPE